MKIRFERVALLTLALLTASHAQPLDQVKLDQFFDRLAEKNKAMGSLVIARDGQILYSRAIGYSQISGSERKPLTAANRFRIGSITKMFTAAMILQFVDEGELKLNATLDAFVPQVPNAGKITIEQILGHRSGIPNVRRDSSQPNANTLPITKDDVLGLIARAAPDFEPGSRYGYSNSGYFLLGLIVEKLAGKSYGDALAERISARIGLNDTYTASGNIDVTRNESLTYLFSGSDWKQGPETHPSILFGAGAIISTPTDLARFAQALFDGKLISRASLDRMKPMRDGEGWGMEPFSFGGKTFYGHTGGADNYGAWLAYEPEEKLAIAYATNAKVHPVGDIVRGVVDIYYRRPFQIPAFETIVVSAEVLDQYVGVYASSSAPVKFTLTRQGSTLFVQPGNQTAAALEATAPDKFQLLGGRVVFQFDAAKGQMILKRGGPEQVFTKEK